MERRLARTIRWSAIWTFAIAATPWSYADEDPDPLDVNKASNSASNAFLGPSTKPLPAWLSGWVDVGYTASTVGTGRLLVEPRPNHIGNELLLNQLVLDLKHAPDPEEDSLGFHAQLFAGSDAWLLAGPGDPTNNDLYFGFVIRQLYVSAHLEILGDGGLEWKIGRAPSYLGYESYQAPMRQLYSMSYQWYYAEDGCDTGTWATWHANESWDLTAGIYLGSNTFFELRGKAPCAVVQALRKHDDSGSNYQASTIVFGDQAIGQGNSVLLEGQNQIVVEYRHLVPLSEQVSQVLQFNVGRSDDVLGNHRGVWYGVLGANQWTASEQFHWQGRYEPDLFTRKV